MGEGRRSNAINLSYGYNRTERKIYMKNYTVNGMGCAACSARVEKAVQELEGVESVSVNLLTNSMNVEGDVEPEVIIKAVEDAGYGAACESSSSP